MLEGPCEHGNEPLESIKCWDIFELLSDQRLFKDSAPYSSIQFFQVVSSGLAIADDLCCDELELCDCYARVCVMFV